MGMSDRWYKNAVIYGIDVEVFMDSDGDGVGDFQGVIGRLDYLSRLGVNCLWLLPFYPSPNRENGYDYGANPLGRYFGEGDEMSLLFNFVLTNYLFLALARRTAEPAQHADGLGAVRGGGAASSVLHGPAANGGVRSRTRMFVGQVPCTAAPP